MRRSIFVLGVLACACSTPDEPLPQRQFLAIAEVVSATFADRVREEAERDAPVSGLAARVGKRQFLFVGGFLNEGIPGYFSDNVAVVRELGLEAETLFPSSLASIEEDAVRIRDEVLARHAASQKPVVLVGHSKGGAGSLLCAMKYPGLLIHGKVDRVIVIQGAIGGSPVADAIADLGTALPVRWRGLEALRTTASREVFRQALAELQQRLSPDERECIRRRVFYVRSSAAEVAFELKETGKHLSACGSGANDGLLLREDMILDGFGNDLGVLEADHAGLTVSGILSRTSARERRGFTRALLREVFRESPPPCPGVR